MSGSRFARVFIAVLAVAGIGTFFFGWWIANGVRRTAAETDRRIRTIGWATLAYADEFGGFPLAADELLAFGAGVESLPDSPGTAWPVARSEALQGADPADLAESLRSIVAVWGEDRAMPPYLKPDGLPTSVGTTPMVNGWLAARAERLRAAR